MAPKLRSTGSEKTAQQLLDGLLPVKREINGLIARLNVEAARRWQNRSRADFGRGVEPDEAFAQRPCG
jgi:hypothetical protein